MAINKELNKILKLKYEVVNVKIKSTHETKVNIPVPGGRVDFNPGQILDVPDELGDRLKERKGFEVVQEDKKPSRSKKEE